MRWKAGVIGLVIISAIGVGCKQQCFVTECDLLHYQRMGLPPNLECSAAQCIQPMGADLPAPPTILDPDREPRYLSLAEAIAIALEQGTVSPSDNLVSFAGPGQGVANDDAIRVFALDPAIRATDIESALSRFDVRWNSSMSWTKTDRPIGNALDTFQSVGRQINASNIDDATVQTGLIKPLPTGGVAGITFSTQYELTNLNARVNPSYRPTLQFAFEQPLLQGFGVEINQLRTAHPGGETIQFQNSSRTEGILITRLRFDETRIDFERKVFLMVLGVSDAYWDLYGSYWTLYSREQALRQAFEAWKINKARFEAGRIPIQDFAQSRQQYELFRGQRIQALADVLERERLLRSQIGLPVSDCHRLVPCDAPTLSPYQPDWCTALNEALALKPELLLARQEIKANQLNLIAAKNQLLPDLRFFSNYDITGLGSQLDGPASVNAFRNFASNHFNDWTVGLRMDVPLGYRDAHALVRSQRLRLAQSYLILRNQERKVALILGLAYRHIFEFYEQIQAQRALREAAAQQLEARFKEFLAGRGTLDFLLEAQRVWADALNSEYSFIVQYNRSLAFFEAQKGTLLQNMNIHLAEGALPECAQIRAVDHQKERTKSLIARERPVPVAACCTDPGHETAGLPILPVNEAPTLPALMGSKPQVPDHLPPGVDALNVRPSYPSPYGQPAPLPRTMPANDGSSSRDLPQLPEAAFSNP